MLPNELFQLRLAEAAELFRLLSDCHPGDILLVEQVDRLSRLNATGWKAAA